MSNPTNSGSNPSASSASTQSQAPANASQAQNQGQSQTPAQSQTQKGNSATQSQERLYTLKVNGKEIQLPESQVIALAQQGHVSTQRLQEAAQKRKEAEMLWEMLDRDTAEVLRRRGKDPRKWAEEYLLENVIKPAQMSPDQKRALDAERELQKYKDAEKKAQEETRQRQMAAKEAEHTKNYNDMFIEALKLSGLPATPETVKRMAQKQLTNLKRKLELTPAQLAKAVREDYILEQKALLSAAEGDGLLEMLGPDVVKKLSKAQIAKLKGRQQFQAKPKEKPSADNNSKKLTWAELQKRNRRI